jgi:hypothetical protein
MHNVVLNRKQLKVEKKKTQFCVVGGGMAGLCAALAAARSGIRTLLIQDRPVLGGNASSEVRMWICGAQSKDSKEGGILEELMLRNIYYNGDNKYTVWDDVLYGACREEPLLEVIFNCSVNEVHAEGRQLKSIRAWHLTRHCWIDIEADFFSDCSGDSILSICGAEVRWGRESRHEFNESHAPEEADNKTMGNSVLIQLREVDEHRPFVAPPWAKKFDEQELEHRGLNPTGHNFWWLEFGGLMDTIDDADKIREENMAIAYGAWDLIKNHPDGRGHNWELEWIGSLPGKRENVRYVGDIVINQNHIEAEGRFEDIVCHGGWSMDDHHPDAIYHRGEPTIFHPAPTTYGIPYRSLYSKDMDNLFCAGRNISATHMAMSSTRVMGTTSLMGQAVGSAAAIAIKNGLSTRGVYESALSELQDKLREDDQYIPWSKRETQVFSLNAVSSTSKHNTDLLTNGIERGIGSEDNGAWFDDGETLSWTLPNTSKINGIRIVCDSDFSNTKRLPCSYPKAGNRAQMPSHLLKSALLEIRDKEGNWQLHSRIENNFRRLIKIPLQVQCSGFRLSSVESWGGQSVHVYSFDAMNMDCQCT